MEFSEKLYELRKQRGLTQEELAKILYVSRTAVSKWESGRGYPGIDSLKGISAFFAVSVDDLLSGDELLVLAEENQKQKESNFRDLSLAFLDVLALLLLFLPLFAIRYKGALIPASLIAENGMKLYLKIAYFSVVLIVGVYGIAVLALQNYKGLFWLKNKNKISFFLSAAALLLFIVTLQVYAAVFAFALFVFKAFVLMKSQ